MSTKRITLYNIELFKKADKLELYSRTAFKRKY